MLHAICQIIYGLGQIVEVKALEVIRLGETDSMEQVLRVHLLSQASHPSEELGGNVVRNINAIFFPQLLMALEQEGVSMEGDGSTVNKEDLIDHHQMEIFDFTLLLLVHLLPVEVFDAPFNDVSGGLVTLVNAVRVGYLRLYLVYLVNCHPVEGVER